MSPVARLGLQLFPLQFDSKYLHILETNMVWFIMQCQITLQLILSLTWCDILWNNSSKIQMVSQHFFNDFFLIPSTFSCPSLIWAISNNAAQSWVHKIWVQDILCSTHAYPFHTGSQGISINCVIAPVKAVLLFLACKLVSCEITTFFSWGNHDSWKWTNALQPAILWIHCCEFSAWLSNQDLINLVLSLMEMTLKFIFKAMEAYVVIYWIYVFIAFLPLLMHCYSIFHCSFLTGYTWVKAAQILSRFFVFLILVMSLIMQITPGKKGAFPFVKPTFLIELIVTHPFPSLGRRAPWILLLHAEQRALWQSAAAAPVQDAVLLWQRPLLVFCSCHCSRNVSHQIHWYEPIWTLISMLEHSISSGFFCVFSSNVFMELQRMVEAGGHLDRLFSPSPLFKQSLLWKRSHAQDF